MTTAPVRIIAGSGRSGTTWLLDVLAEANALRPVFEPLHPRAVPQAAPFACRYVRRDEQEDDARRFLARVFDGDLHGWWTDYRVRPDRLRPRPAVLRSTGALYEYVRRWRKLYAQRRRYAPALRRTELLVKFIRANLMLGWLRAAFDARIVLVLRHPGAVVESRLRLGGDDWEPHEQLDRYMSQNHLQADYLFQYNDLLRGPLSAAEAHTAIWCIENQFPLTHLSAGDCTIAFYEHLLSGEPQPWRSVLDGLALVRIPGEALRASPSQSSAPARDAAFDASRAHRWHGRLDDASRREIGAVLRAMGVTAYDIDDPRPRVHPGPPTLEQAR
jgi:hypothetical protein